MSNHICRTLCLSACLTALPALSVKPLIDGSVTVAADNEATARGIHAFSILEGETSTPVVRILDESQKERAAIHFDRTRPHAVLADYASGSATFHLLFQRKVGRIEITLADGRQASWVVDTVLRRWVGTGATSEVLAVARKGMEEIALAASALPAQTRSPDTSRNPLVYYQLPPPDPWGGSGSGGCWPDAANAQSDTSYDFRKSQACARAQQSVNEMCSNAVCWGCCQTGPCDCVCFPGTDFYCWCNALGFPCSY